MRCGFSKDFLWGVSTSAHQIEGSPDVDGKGVSIWDTFCSREGAIAGGESGRIAADHYRRWAGDLAIMKELGVRAYRFSTAWTRIQPNGKGRAESRGLDFYERLVDALLSSGIEPWLCLYHWDLPQSLQDEGGWRRRDTAHRFADYAEIVAGALGDRVGRFLTHNEPWIAAVLGHFTGEHAPGLKDPVAAYLALQNMLLSHGLAYDAIKASVAGPAKVGIALNLSPVHPASDAEADRQAAVRMDAVINRSTLDPLLRGSYPLDESFLGRLAGAFTRRPGDARSVRRLDFLGINYYSRTVVRNDPSVPVAMASETRPAGEYSDMWELYPEGMREALLRIQRDYSPACEIYVTENGAPFPDTIDPDGRIRDERRIGYLRDNLVSLRRAMDEGVPVKGYFVWSILDNFEWQFGYGPRFGLVAVDFATQERRIKESGRWYARVIAESGFETEEGRGAGA
jgi:beta-glucosidase